MHCFPKSPIKIRKYHHFTNRTANHCCQSLNLKNKTLKTIPAYITALEICDNTVCDVTNLFFNFFFYLLKSVVVTGLPLSLLGSAVGMRDLDVRV